MLVLLSDLHFTDGTIDAFNVPAYAFEALAEYLKTILRRPGTDIQRVEVALLGDIFDVLRSSQWHASPEPPGPPPMPWHPPGPGLEARLRRILDATLHANAEALGRLARLADALGTAVSFRYLPGNHDRTLNAFASTRAALGRALRLDHDPARPFPASALWPEYGVFAEHGDRYDPFCSENANACVAGAFAVQLMNGLVIHLRAELPGDAGREGDPSLDLAAQEIDHVRPSWAAALWFQRLLEQARGERVRRALRRAWEAALEDFRGVCLAQPDLGPSAILLALLQRPDFGDAKALRDDAALRELLAQHDAAYVRGAIETCRTAAPAADLVVFGHTHVACRVPFELEDGRRRAYLNAGTWRHTVNLVPAPDGAASLLVPWDEISFLVVFREGECRGLTGAYRFEAWQGTRA